MGGGIGDHIIAICSKIKQQRWHALVGSWAD
jgi:hypothetical protein